MAAAKFGSEALGLAHCFVLSLGLVAFSALLAAQGAQGQDALASAARLEETKPCVWKGSGGTFNLEDLSSSAGHYETGWVKGSIYYEKYYFQLCGNMHFDPQTGPYTECNSTLGCPTSCSGGGSGSSCGNACSALQLQNDPRSYMFSYTYYHTIGKAGPEISYQLIDAKKPSAGVKYVMNGGDSCGTNGQIVNHTFTVNIQCDSKIKTAPTDFQVQSINECAYETTFKHKAGYPVGGGGSGGLTFGGVFLIIFFCGGFTYFAGFFAYNMKYAQLTGLDAVPHKGFWMELPVLAKEGTFFTWEKLQALYSKTKAAYTSLR